MLILPLRDRNPLKWIRFHYVNASTIGLCIGVFVWQSLLAERELTETIISYALVPAVFAGGASLTAGLTSIPAELTLLSSAFLHGDWLHLGGNMLFLWVFGDNVEDCLGHRRYIAFYALCAIAAGLVHVAIDPSSLSPTIGASGAVSGVLGGYFLLHPKARVWALVVFPLPLPLPAILVLGAWFLMQLFGATDPGAATDIAWWAHVGGFIAGAILVIPLRRKEVPLFDGMLSQPRNR